MRNYHNRSKWQQVRGKKRLHWGILTVDDLDKNNVLHTQLIAQLRARYKADKEQGQDKSIQK